MRETRVHSVMELTGVPPDLVNYFDALKRGVALIASSFRSYFGGGAPVAVVLLRTVDGEESYPRARVASDSLSVVVAAGPAATETDRPLAQDVRSIAWWLRSPSLVVADALVALILADGDAIERSVVDEEMRAGVDIRDGLLAGTERPTSADYLGGYAFDYVDEKYHLAPLSPLLQYVARLFADAFALWCSNGDGRATLGITALSFKSLPSPLSSFPSHLVRTLVPALAERNLGLELPAARSAVPGLALDWVYVPRARELQALWWDDGVAPDAATTLQAAIDRIYDKSDVLVQAFRGTTV